MSNTTVQFLHLVLMSITVGKQDTQLRLVDSYVKY